MGRVLRANQVQFVGSRELRIDPTTAPKANGVAGPVAPARVAIVENTPEYALLEITCSCGRTTQVRCEYAAPVVAAAPEAPKEP